MFNNKLNIKEVTLISLCEDFHYHTAFPSLCTKPSHLDVKLYPVTLRPSFNCQTAF